MLRPLLVSVALALAGCQSPSPTAAVPPTPAPATPPKLVAEYKADSELVALAQNSREWLNHWNGVPLLQFPNDLMMYQNLIYELHPDAIIETGTYYGGLTLYLATILEGLDDPAPIITVDLEPKNWNKLMASVKSGKMQVKKTMLDRVTFIAGNSVAPETLQKVEKAVKGRKKILVLLDSLHEKDHVLQEIRGYSKFVPVGGLLLVTDTQLDNTEYLDSRGPGPRAAVAAFLAESKDFELYTPEKQYMISAVHGGILKRVR